MKILILNGSPKADNSITLQHMRFLETREPDIETEVIPIGKAINSLERNQQRFDEVTEKMRTADAVVWSFPVYYALVPSQMKRFVELLYERKGKGWFAGMYATALTTSINFFDHTAHNYVQAVCEDLGFAYVKGYSAHMDDFFKTQEREKLARFFSWFLKTVQQKTLLPKKYAGNVPEVQVFEPISAPNRDTSLSSGKDSSGKILLLTDTTDPDTNLWKMIRTFEEETRLQVDIKDIRDSGMSHGCLGCCTCGYENTCIQKDGFTRFFNDHLKTAEIILICGSIRDHYLSALWKQFFDRCFFNGHAPVLQGKQLGFMISGPLRHRQNLRELLDVFADSWHMKFRGVVTDEAADSKAVVREIKGFARTLELARETDLEFGASFYRTGGQKLFRDFIFNTTAVFTADHRFYKKSGLYATFPQRQWQRRLRNAVFALMVSIPFLRRQIHREFIPGMVAPYKKKLRRLAR